MAKYFALHPEDVGATVVPHGDRLMATRGRLAARIEALASTTAKRLVVVDPSETPVQALSRLGLLESEVSFFVCAGRTVVGREVLMVSKQQVDRIAQRIEALAPKSGPCHHVWRNRGQTAEEVLERHYRAFPADRLGARTYIFSWLEA